MRFVLYNLRYGTGGQRYMLPWSGYLRDTTENMSRITGFIKSLEPDVVGLVEVDAGSYRHRRRSQSEAMADELGHYHTYKSKYGDTGLARMVPVLNKQGNAFLARDSITNAHFHYFDKGLKRLVIELEFDNLVIFLVHLALGSRVRHRQLGDLYALVKDTAKPHIVAGDFNSLWGEQEIRLFLAATGLQNANSAGVPSFPSWAPRRHLDFVLHSPDIRSGGFSMPDVVLSDHLPLVFDFEIVS